jgi:hypothetical protein
MSFPYSPYLEWRTTKSGHFRPAGPLLHGAGRTSVYGGDHRYGRERLPAASTVRFDTFNALFLWEAEDYSDNTSTLTRVPMPVECYED